MAGRIAYYGGIVKDGLIFDLDAAKLDSYPRTGILWSDVSGNQNNGTLVNGPTFNSDNGGSIVFDGVNDYVNFTPITFSNSSYTLEMFGNIKGLLESSANRRSIFGNSSYAGEFSNTTTYFTNITVNSVDTYFNFIFSSAGSIITGQTFHWVFTLDFTTKNVFMYFNGTRITSANTQLNSYTNISTTFTRFGIWQTVRPYIGNLYSTRIYNRALTQQEVTQNYNATKGRFGL